MFSIDELRRLEAEDPVTYEAMYRSVMLKAARRELTESGEDVALRLMRFANRDLNLVPPITPQDIGL